MYDAQDVLQSLVTKTASFNGTGKNIKTGTPKHGQHARFLVSDYKSPGGAGAVWELRIEHSSDDTTYHTLAPAQRLTCATGAATTEVLVPFNTTRAYVRAALELVTTSGTPTISYLADIGLGFPRP